jgi:hypothetical protein
MHYEFSPAAADLYLPRLGPEGTAAENGVAGHKRVAPFAGFKTSVLFQPPKQTGPLDKRD